jgi:hypothetical protein
MSTWKGRGVESAVVGGGRELAEVGGREGKRKRRVRWLIVTCKME